jgi:hypothetical protein
MKFWMAQKAPSNINPRESSKQETRRTTEDILKFRELIGDAYSIPKDGRIDLIFSKAYFESCEEANAKVALSNIRDYADRLSEWTQFSIVDFPFMSYGDKSQIGEFPT